MTLYIFNPEHDIALAADRGNFTAPHAGRQLRRDLAFLPALWADFGDEVLVERPDVAERGFAQLMCSVARVSGRPLTAHAQWVEKPSDAIARIDPWGWDRALCHQLSGRRMNVRAELLPTEQQLADIRRLSHRQTAADVLKALQTDGTVGKAFRCASFSDVERLVATYGRVVMKAPWSSSGRGLRFVDACSSTLSDEQSTDRGWLRHVLERQGSVMVEPYYNKVKDFGMEFNIDADGNANYMGLSLFHTLNGAYTGNVLATEARKTADLSHYVSADLLAMTRSKLSRELSNVFSGHYVGPLGVDMMVVARTDGGGFSLHPCVEINVRRTMGHVALALTRLVNPTDDDDMLRAMRIEFKEGNYKLKIERL